MSSIPNSAMPHSYAAEAKPEKARPRSGSRFVKVVTAPAVFALGLSLMALSGLAALVRSKSASR